MYLTIPIDDIPCFFKKATKNDKLTLSCEISKSKQLFQI